MISATEIYDLRKSGSLDLALSLFLEHSNQQNISSEIRVAIAWVYYDLAKLAQEDTNNTEITQYYGAFLALEIQKEEELIYHKFARLAHFNAPWGQQYELAEQQSREGLHAEAIQLCRGIADNCPEFSSNELYGWILWRFLQEQSTLEKQNAKGINEALDLYLELEMPRPSRLHSTMLCQVIKLVSKVDFHAYKFMYHWGWENFRPEDIERYTDEKGLHYSLMEKAIHCYTNVLLHTLDKYKYKKDIYQQLQTDALKFEAMLDGIITEFSDNPYLQIEREKLLPFLIRE